uniref:KH RNA binding domain containing, signal transduction associated 2 n=1 Tax=Anser brachyrhynchus TaxID=132585 RepID=A0A8B9D037_9AVES
GGRGERVAHWRAGRRRRRRTKKRVGGGRVGTSSARRAEPGTRTAPAPRAAKGGGGAGGAEGSAPPREGAAGAALRCAPAGRRAGRARRRKRRRRRWPEARSQPAAAQPAPGLASRRGPEEMEQEKYLPELMAEKDSLDPSFVHAMRLLADEIEKFQGSEGKKEDEEKKYLDVISNKNIKLSERVLIPVKQYPKIEACPATSI